MGPSQFTIGRISVGNKNDRCFTTGTETVSSSQYVAYSSLEGQMNIVCTTQLGMNSQCVDMFDKLHSAVKVLQVELHEGGLSVPDDGGTDIIAPQVVGSGDSVDDEWFYVHIKFRSTEKNRFFYKITF